MRRCTLRGFLLCLCGAPAPAAAQRVTIGPEVGVAQYREVASSLRYSGVGPGAAATATWRRLRADAAVVSMRMTPASGGAATQSFRATEIDAWLGWDALDYLRFEVGLTRRSPDSDFAAQSLGAVRVGAATHYLLGPGATISLRGDYLAGARFSGGGSAPLALELGLGLDVELSRRLHAAVRYAFERLDRRTNPGGGAEASVPIERSLARVGLAAGF